MAQPAPTETDTETLTPAEFAEEIDASRATVYRLISQGLVDVVHIPNLSAAKDGTRGTRYRITREAADRYKATLQGVAS